MKTTLRLPLMSWLIVAILAGCAPAPRFLPLSPDWQNPDQGRVRQSLVSLLRAADRDPMSCSMFFFESKNLGAIALGNCMFGFTTGLASTGDETLIRGALARQVAVEVLGYADKKKAARDAVAGTRAIATFVLLGLAEEQTIDLSAYQDYSPPQLEEAEKRAAESLRSAGDPDPARTLRFASTRLRDAGVVEPWPTPALYRSILMAVVPVPGLERPNYALGQKWIRNDGEYKLTKIASDLYTFSAGPGLEIHLTRDLLVAEAKKGGWVTEFDALPKMWPPVVGKWGTWQGRWRPPNDPTRFAVNYIWSIDAYEEIQVPAGTFKAFRILLSWEAATTGAPFARKQVISWYAPEAGQLVKAEFSDAGPLTYQVIAVEPSGTPAKDK